MYFLRNWTGWQPVPLPSHYFGRGLELVSRRTTAVVKRHCAGVRLPKIALQIAPTISPDSAISLI
jgi:hypothetical protein